jgi:hypothetical protein
MATLIAGTVLVPRTERSFEDAVLHVVLEEVGRADAFALSIAKLRVTGISHKSGTVTMVEFAIDDSGLPVVAANHYALRAWVHLGAGGNPGMADLFSTRRHAVLTHGHGACAQMPVTSVAGLTR